MKWKDQAPLPAFFKADGIEAGCDEAGCGCLAGHICAAAVILPQKTVVSLSQL